MSIIAEIEEKFGGYGFVQSTLVDSFAAVAALFDAAVADFKRCGVGEELRLTINGVEVGRVEAPSLDELIGQMPF
jgi:hypothetical protein